MSQAAATVLHQPERTRYSWREHASAKSAVPRLFVLELNAGCIHLMNADGSDRTTIVSGCHLPDGIVVDVEGGKLYWCDREGMRVMRCNLDGTYLETLVEAGRGGRRAMRKQQLLPSQASNIQARDMEPCR
jgi:hypothetical protein